MTVAGVGPGNPKYLTIDVYEKIKDAEHIISFGRIGNSIKSLREDYEQVNRVDDIVEILKDNKDVLLLASGDPNFFGIVEYLKKKEIPIKEVLPGLSSFQYMMAKLEKSWHDSKFISLHGRSGDLKKIKDSKLSIILIDKDNNPSYISRELYKIGIKGVMYIGFNLSYDDERIIKVNIGEEVENYSPLGVVIIENEMD
ncbi:precorrin-6y C5,15-methyltransferase (decarboxylating) subunit CbiE [Tissierella creatinini]|nr:precorrin-6y C5,15-methyltransferase (decarboxylating) subunit CbiE [Tissierella creatinini]TJX65626.1 precorrin-6y C5,15-methyltransferase (decarboxylating) subunit CbiE [Soehngenia saccharolytica]